MEPADKLRGISSHLNRHFGLNERDSKETERAFFKLCERLHEKNARSVMHSSMCMYLAAWSICAKVIVEIELSDRRWANVLHKLSVPLERLKEAEIKALKLVDWLVI